MQGDTNANMGLEIPKGGKEMKEGENGREGKWEDGR